MIVKYFIELDQENKQWYNMITWKTRYNSLKIHSINFCYNKIDLKILIFLKFSKTITHIYKLYIFLITLAFHICQHIKDDKNFYKNLRF